MARSWVTKGLLWGVDYATKLFLSSDEDLPSVEHHSFQAKACLAFNSLMRVTKREMPPTGSSLLFRKSTDRVQDLLEDEKMLDPKKANQQRKQFSGVYLILESYNHI